MKNKLYVSANQINIFADCAFKYKLRYLDGIKIPKSSPHIIFGIAIHKVLERYHKFKGQQQFKPWDLYEMFDEEWEYAIENAPLPVIFGERQQYELRKTGLLGLENYLKYLKNDLTPLIYYDIKIKEEKPAIEIRFDVPIKNINGKTRNDYTLCGYIDLIEYLPDLGLCIIDHKTSTRYYDDFKIKTDFQLLSYAYAFRYLLSKKIYFPEISTDKEDAVVFHVFIKNKNANIIQYVNKITDDDIIRFSYIVNKTIEGIKNGIYLPSYRYSCKWCEYRDICQKWDYSKDLSEIKPVEINMEEIKFDLYE